MRRQRDNEEGEGAAEPPTMSSRVAAPPVSSQESAPVPEEGMRGTCSEFPALVVLGIDEVWCDACGQKCTLDRVRVKAKTKGTWQCKNCDTTYRQVMSLKGDPKAATEEFYAAAAGKDMQETKRLWEHHANKYKYKAKGFPIQGIFDKILPQNVQPCSMFGTMDLSLIHI